MKTFEENSSEYKQAKAISMTSFGTKEWLTGIYDENGDFAELDKLYEWLRLSQIAAIAKKTKEESEKDLMKKIAEQYPKLSEEDCKSLMIDAKWYTGLDCSIDDEVNRIILGLITRVNDIGERYESTLSKLKNNVDELSQKVEQHLKKMGPEWFK
jgi:type I restriction enzyme M protein